MAREVGEGYNDARAGAFAVDGARVQLPNWLFLYLIAQLIGGVWWAATTSATQAFQAGQINILQQDLKVESLQMETLREKLAEHGWNPDISIHPHQ